MHLKSFFVSCPFYYFELTEKNTSQYFNCHLNCLDTGFRPGKSHTRISENLLLSCIHKNCLSLYKGPYSGLLLNGFVENSKDFIFIEMTTSLRCQMKDI